MQSQFKKLKGIVFDKDGTLFDFNAVWSVWCDRVVSELSQGDSTLKARLAKKIGYDIESRSFVTGSVIVSGAADESTELLASLLPGTSAGQVEEVAVKHLHNLPLVPVTDLDALFKSLKRAGLLLGVATNDSEASAITQLKASHIEHYFDFICGFDSGHGSKPGPGMLKAFCDTTDLPAESVMMVGDSLHDLDAGKNAGVGWLVGVLTGPARAQELAPVADEVLPDIGALTNLLVLD